jgi:hypothetical protein
MLYKTYMRFIEIRLAVHFTFPSTVISRLHIIRHMHVLVYCTYIKIGNAVRNSFDA